MEVVTIQGELNRQQGIYYQYDRHSLPLGEGGMGRIFQGFRVDQYSGNRMYVAIKEINEDIARDPQIVERAQREASIQIEHDNLLRMYDFVANVEYLPLHDTNILRYYMVMERLVGVNLDQMLTGVSNDKSGLQIPLAQELYAQYTEAREVAVCRIMKSILSGVMALHDNGYIHRDIDPSNIMITIDGKIKLIDFGVCKHVNSSVPEKQLTSAGSFLGKVDYAAPELAYGDINNQNSTTDIYALGVLMYQLLVGKLPFTGSKQDILKQQVSSKLPLKNITHKGLRKVVEKATEKKQDKRYISAAEMIAAIDQAMAKDRATTIFNEKIYPSLPIWWWPVAGVTGLVAGAIIKIITTLW